MHLPELFAAHLPRQEFRSYLHAPTPRMPPLDIRELRVDALCGDPMRDIGTLIEGNGALLIRYKGHGGGVVSARETDDGETWDFLQVQGSKSKKSYRVSSGMSWRRCLADQWRDYAEHPDADVRRLTMPTLNDITGLDGTKDYESARDGYGIVRSALGLQWSDVERRYVRDIARSGIAFVLAPQTIAAASRIVT